MDLTENKEFIADDLEFQNFKVEQKAEDTNVNIDIIEDEKSFHQMEDEWEQLAQTAGAPVYVSFQWLSCWWKHFGKHPKRDLFIIALYDDIKLIGIAPFYKGVSALGSRIFHRRLHLMGCGVSDNEFLGYYDDYGYSDFLDIIAHPDYENKVAKQIADVLTRNRMNFDVVCFQHVSDESKVVTELLPYLENQQEPYRFEQTDECPYLTLPETLDKYLEEIGSSSRRRRFRKNLEPCGDKYNVEEPGNQGMVQKGMEILYKLHQQRWNSRGYPGVFFDDRYFNFLKEFSEIAYRKGWLWFKLASDEEGYCAVRWAINYGNRLFDCASGFDGSSPSSKYRPGLGLLSLMIKEGIEMHASRVEMLRGSERYKFDFTSESRYNWRLTVPLHNQKSRLHSIINALINRAAEIYNLIQQEWALLRIHYKKAGLLKMFISYGSFRIRRLSKKIKNSNWFSKKQ